MYNKGGGEDGEGRESSGLFSSVTKVGLQGYRSFGRDLFEVKTSESITSGE